MAGSRVPPGRCHACSSQRCQGSQGCQGSRRSSHSQCLQSGGLSALGAPSGFSPTKRPGYGAAVRAGLGPRLAVSPGATGEVWARTGPFGCAGPVWVHAWLSVRGDGRRVGEDRPVRAGLGPRFALVRPGAARCGREPPSAGCRTPPRRAGPAAAAPPPSAGCRTPPRRAGPAAAAPPPSAGCRTSPRRARPAPAAVRLSAAARPAGCPPRPAAPSPPPHTQRNIS